MLNSKNKAETRLAAAKCFLPEMKEMHMTSTSVQVSITGDLGKDLGHICELFKLTQDKQIPQAIDITKEVKNDIT